MGSVVVVNPLSSGAVLKKAAKEEGLRVIGVFTSPFEEGEASTADCDQVIQSSNPKEILTKLLASKTKIKGVIPGTNSGVELADLLAEDLGLYHNPLSLSSARRSKLEMRKAIQKAHLSCPPFAACHTIEEVEEFAKNHPFPLVIQASQGGSFVCNTLEELKERFQAIQRHSFALMEEFINGAEYIVNLFCDGKDIHITDVWLYENWSCILIRPHDVPGVVEYAIEATKALGIERGAAHAEIKDDPKRGPTLVEMSAKLCDKGTPLLLHPSMNFDLFKGTIHAFTDEKVSVPKYISIYKHFGMAFVVALETGKVETIEGLDEIQKLPSYIHHTLSLKKGDLCTKTTDLKNPPLTVHLGHKNRTQLFRDIQSTHHHFKIRVYRS